MHSLDFEYGDKTIQDFINLYEKGQLNLEPGFQRDSVWTISDRKKLIESLFQHYPVPSIFLYRRNENGEIRYDVIDGKQRIETVLIFQGIGRLGPRFSIKMKLEPEGDIEEWDWAKIKKHNLAHLLRGYKFQTVETIGDLSDIIDLFVRINSTGKMLTGAEKRHARFYHSEFLKQAAKLAEKKRGYFLEHSILTAQQISRMKHVELLCELMASIQAKGLINKKTALDGIIGGYSLNARMLNKIVQETIRVFNLLEKMFPLIKTTRFANTVDFYSLFVLTWKMDKEGYVLIDAKRNKEAQSLLILLSNGVDIVRQKVKKAEAKEPDQQFFVDYLLTIQGSTDSLGQRENRETILKKVFGKLFERKDDQRSFTPEQRRLIWHTSDAKCCVECGKPLTWSNFTIDHIKPHARGGKSMPSNAALMCQTCNSKKGIKKTNKR
jgi:hypothetical protein